MKILRRLQLLQLLQLKQQHRYVCPNCAECIQIFSSGGGKALAELVKVPLLGVLPIDPRVGQLAGIGKAAVEELPDSETSRVSREIVKVLTTDREVGDC